MNINNEVNDANCEFISSHNGKVIKRKIVNSYEIWKNRTNDELFVKMKILRTNEKFQVIFDHEDLDKIIKHVWIYNFEGYVINNTLDTYIHNLIVGNEVDKTNNTYIKHNNDNNLDNRKINLIMQQITDKENNIFISSHKGHKLKDETRNSYEIWKDNNNKLFVKMNIYSENGDLTTLFDHDDLPKVKSLNVLNKHLGTWCVTKAGYIMNSTTKQYLHHLITNFVGTGKGFQKLSIDHNNRNKLDNRKANLERATVKQQQENSKGRIKNTKRERQYNAIPLPNGIIQDMIPTYVNYMKEELKEYFVINKHPMFQNGLSINGQPVNKQIKSIQAQWVNQYAKPKVPYPIINKLNEIIEKLEKLNEIYKIWEQGDKINKNIKIIGDKVINDIINPRIARNTKKVYKYDVNNILVDEYDSVVNTADINQCNTKSISTAIKSGQMFRNHYYRTTQI